MLLRHPQPQSQPFPDAAARPVAAQEAAARWPGADMVRAIAMLCVFAHHAATNSVLHPNAAAMAEFLRSGSDLFLALSGALVYLSAVRFGGSYRDFLTRRARRIYPVLLAVMLIYGVAHRFIHPEMPLKAFTAKLLSTLALLPAAFDQTPILIVTWTLGPICLFYLIVMPLVRAEAKLSLPARIALWLAVAVVFYMIRPRTALAPLGALATQMLGHRKVPLWCAGLLGLELARAFPAIPTGIIHACFITGALAFALAVARGAQSGPAAAVFSKLSYGFYLVHVPILIAMARLFPVSWIAAPSALLVSLAASAALHLAIERRFLPHPQGIRPWREELGSWLVDLGLNRQPQSWPTRAPAPGLPATHA